MEVYITPRGNGWVILDACGLLMCRIVWRKYYIAEDFCIENGWTICEYEVD